MTVTLFSNFLNPHQLEFCFEMAKLIKNDFTFVATQPFNQNQVSDGFEDINLKYDFCLPSYLSKENYNKSMDLLKTSDVVIIGSAPEKMFRIRMRTNKLTFRYSERSFKPLSGNKYNPIALAFMVKGNTIYNKRPLYMLCASAYTAKDFKAVGAYKNKAFKWGYFPKGSVKTFEELLKLKEKNNIIKLLWAGRMIDWKHGEIAIEIAKYLNDRNIDFELLMLGSGDKKAEWETLVSDYRLEHCVKFIGAVSNGEAIEYMEKSDILLATSDENEGWGAVVNEAMSAACIVAGCESMGSVPYLIEDDYNGIVFKENDIENLKIKVEKIILHKEKRIELSRFAKNTISEIWNAKTAAENLICICNDLLMKSNCDIKKGPCSKA